VGAGFADRMAVSITPQIRGLGDGMVRELVNGSGVTAGMLELNGQLVVILDGDSVIVTVSIGAPRPYGPRMGPA
jgi:hypothetical protein